MTKIFAVGFYDDLTSDPENPQYGLTGYSNSEGPFDPLGYMYSNPNIPMYLTQFIYKDPNDIYDASYYAITNSSFLYDNNGQLYITELIDGFGGSPIINRMAVRNGKIYLATDRGIFWALTSNNVFSFIDATWGWNIKDIFITSTGRVYCAGEAGTAFTSPDGLRTGTKAQFAVLNPNHTVAVVSGNTHEWSTGAPWSVDGPNEMMVKEGAGTSGQDLIIIKVSGTNHLYKNDASGVGSFTRLGVTANTAGFNTTGGAQQPKKVYLSPNGRIFVFGVAAGSYTELYATYSDDNGASWTASQNPNHVNPSLSELNFVTFASYGEANSIYIPNDSYYIYSHDGGATFLSDPAYGYYYEMNTRIIQLHSTAYYTPPAAPSGTAPTDITLSASSISESAAIGSTVGTLSATDAEGGAMTFSLVAGAGSTDNAGFTIDGNALKTAVALDYETKSSYSIRVRATDSTSLSFEKQLTINVSNVNEAPSNITLSAASIQEGNAVNAVIGTLSAIDPDTGDTSFTFSISGGADAAKFNISGNSLRASQAFDYEAPADANADNVYVVEITAQDAGGLSYTKSFNISVSNNASDDNVAPSSIILSAASIQENNAVNAVIGTLSAIDPNSGDTSFTFSISGGADAAKFNISGNSLRASQAFNYEEATSHSVTIRATDAGGLYKDQSFTINVSNDASDDNVAPSSITLSAASIQEGNAVNAVIGTLSGVDANGDALTFSIVSGGDKFNVNGTQLRASVAFNYEEATSHSVTIRATDAGGLYKDQSFTINVSNSTSDDPVSLPATQMMIGGKAKVSVANDPRVVPVRKSDGSALPTGSVVRNSVDNKKFVKRAGLETDYIALQSTVPAAWKWNSDGETAFDVLQDM